MVAEGTAGKAVRDDGHISTNHCLIRNLCGGFFVFCHAAAFLNG